MHFGTLFIGVVCPSLPRSDETHYVYEPLSPELLVTVEGKQLKYSRPQFGKLRHRARVTEIE